ncbi:sulfurtransferase [Shewanella sp. UCD-KL12]|uniref:sulfurtransferase n=1 Tax=Shewanella sp. UCD-KL12 TaxID=1917163 RepID=UPI0009708585|nr:sulfurtransferase [Shewanella sp. UCD-KL12]
MTLTSKSPIVTTQWLEQNLDNERVILLDASMEKVVGKTPIEYDSLSCIPGAMKIDLEKELCDLSSTQVHAFPTREKFELIVSVLGIKKDSLVVIYDNQGIYSSPRAWWIFQVMGFENTLVLDGGLPQWLAEGRETTSHYKQTAPLPLLNNKESPVDLCSDKVCDSRYVLEKMADKNISIYDARGAARFLGQAAEPRAGIRSGHIPNATNLPFAKVLHGHCLKTPVDLRALFTEVTAIDSNNPIAQTERIFSCGSGITACILILASVTAGHDNNVLYDGSWADWGSNHRLPIEV